MEAIETRRLSQVQMPHHEQMQTSPLEPPRAAKHQSKQEYRSRRSTVKYKNKARFVL